MATFDLRLTLDPDGETPVFLQIARAIIRDTLRGRLRAGTALPGTRPLAISLGVHRNTVVAAYRELSAEGWVTSRPGGTTCLCTTLPDRAPRRFARSLPVRTRVPERAGFDLALRADSHGLSHLDTPAEQRPGTIVLSSGVPDLRLVPVDALARAYRRALRTLPGRLLAYGDPRGEARLRSALASMLSSLRGLAATPETVMVTRGSQMALDLVARALIAPGDVVAVEDVGYPPAWGAFQQAGARLMPVPVDSGGLRVDALEALCARMPVRAVYVTPHHQYPTTVTLAPARRLHLLELARVQRIAVLEDDYDYEFHYEGRAVLPLASADAHGVVVHVSTLSKILAPGLRIGFVVAPAPLLDRMARLRELSDRQGDQALEHAVAELIEEGELQRHTRRMRTVYAARRASLVASLTARLTGTVTVQPSSGGMALWANVSPHVELERWSERAAARGVVFPTARRFTFDGRNGPHVRLGFAARTEAELDEGVQRMAAAL